MERMSHSTKSEDFQRDLTRFSKSGKLTSDQPGARKKNIRRGPIRKFACNDSFSKQTIVASHNGSPARPKSQHDNLKSSRSTFCRTVELHERDSHPNRSSAVISSPKETQYKDQPMPSSGKIRLDATSSDYVRISSSAIQSSDSVPARPAIPYRDAPTEHFSPFYQAPTTSDSIQQQPMDGNWDQRGTYFPGSLNSSVHIIPAPPGLSHPVGWNYPGTATGIPFGEPSASSAYGWKCHETTNHRLKENPFESSCSVDEEDRIDAELQELGGRMVGSILDF
ncbi:hypothetical protein FisN_9Lh216 [Fistulifera solaris]|uniref:Uncharacterized protein n=1 Tax=Fistulifera solaris TaxID=1519565 RepID=A0A1Z5KLV8_FISSO|nr:hypothetical protein FisN_9Lh216 [Fistulifera solaris]|eukprot:GAX26918.1 hypothetical protein FisN_9Lh216 [Fistulifera solaris]